VARRNLGRRLSLADLTEAGTAGLRRAAERFDPAAGPAFATYAVWWVRQAVAGAVAGHDRLLRIPRS
jgi:RNA polymerase primary sigma factor